MPGGNGTGPLGEGPMTGRAAGSCVGNKVAGFSNSNGMSNFGGGRGRGCGRGMGRGLGYRKRFIQNQNWNGPVMDKEQEEQYITNEINSLNGTLNALKKRLDEIKEK